MEPWEFELIVGTTHNIKMPDGKNIRKIIVDTINEVQRKILKTDEGDTKSISSIIQVFTIYKTPKFIIDIWIFRYTILYFFINSDVGIFKADGNHFMH